MTFVRAQPCSLCIYKIQLDDKNVRGNCTTNKTRSWYNKHNFCKLAYKNSHKEKSAQKIKEGDIVISIYSENSEISKFYLKTNH